MFIKLTERLGFNFGFKRYDSNPQMQGVNLLSLNGNDFIDPENIDAYDIYSTTPHLWAVIQRRGDLLASGQWKHYKLVNGQKVEVGYRTSCGKKDTTHKVFEEWLKVIKSLRKDGFIINEENVKHPNKSPTIAQGFWNSIIYSINTTKLK